MIKSIDGGLTAAGGYLASGVRAGIKQRGLDVAVIFSEKPCVCAGVFTKNVFKAASVVHNTERIKSGLAQAIVVNSGNANSFTAEKGLDDNQKMCDIVAEELGIESAGVLAASTGIIGEFLPMDKLEKGIREACRNLSIEGASDAAKAILTTDTVEKELAVEVEMEKGSVKIGGICKGAGMIGPNMATMLCFITTDANISQELLQNALFDAVNESFNMTTIDGDNSTNDQVLVLANAASPAGEVLKDSKDYELFSEAIRTLCVGLAKKMARDGEGATKMVEVAIRGARTREDARKAAMCVSNSPLVKTAVFGRDPNWGRVIAAIGRSEAEVDTRKVSLAFGDVLLVKDGRPAGYEEKEARDAMGGETLVIAVDLGCGKESATAYTCDFSYDYVKINAEYHT